ncbi:hypothetical protein ACTWOG_004815 [Serratia marcescens]
MAIDGRLDHVMLYPDDKQIVQYDSITCHVTYFCGIELRVFAKRSGNICAWAHYPMVTFGKGRRYTLEEANSEIMRQLPQSATSSGMVPDDVGDCRPIVQVYAQNGYFNSGVLASSEEGTLPPVDPPPPVPLFCNIDEVSNGGNIDFGLINHESKSASASAILSCNGDESARGNAKLLFSNKSQPGSNYIDLKNERGEVIATKLAIDSVSGSNEKIISINAGYRNEVQLFAYIDEAKVPKGASGEFVGSAIFTIEVI